MWDIIWSDPTHFYNNNNDSWIILNACKVERCGINYSERQKDINLFIQIKKQTDRQTDRQTGRQTDGRTDRHKSFIDMRYYTEQYSKSNSIELNKRESNQIESNQFEIK